MKDPAENMELFHIKKCSPCPNGLYNLEELETMLRAELARRHFNDRFKALLNPQRSPRHQRFHIVLAGCPNCCSQPQIKDFGIIGQAKPAVATGCNNYRACVSACPENAVSTESGTAVINPRACLLCGRCVRACPGDILHIEQRGYRVLAGGKLGRHPQLATELLTMANAAQTAAMLGRCVELFLTQGQPGEKFGQFLNRLPSTAALNPAQQNSGLFNQDTDDRPRQ